MTPAKRGNLASQVGKFVLYEGRVGHVLVAALDPNHTVRRIVLRVLSHPATETELDLVGARANEHPYLGHGRYVRVPDLWSWPVVETDEPVAKPVDGKTYTWKWIGREHGPSNGNFRNGWQKDYFPICHYCQPTKREVNGRTVSYDNVHAPTLIYNEQCGCCHKDGVCNEKGVCSPYSYP